jgi:hypothetical protein
MGLYLQQCRAIIVSNIIFSHRNHHFWKLFLLQFIFIVWLIIKTNNET